jgi:hypothetical protein
VRRIPDESTISILVSAGIALYGLATDGRGYEAAMTLFVDDRNAGAHVGAHRCLCRIEDGDVFAYAARGNEFVRLSDHVVWATEQGDALVSARSGEPLAYRRGKVFFAADTDEPLYYERAR